MKLVRAWMMVLPPPGNQVLDDRETKSGPTHGSSARSVDCQVSVIPVLTKNCLKFHGLGQTDHLILVRVTYFGDAPRQGVALKITSVSDLPGSSFKPVSCSLQKWIRSRWSRPGPHRQPDHARMGFNGQAGTGNGSPRSNRRNTGGQGQTDYRGDAVRRYGVDRGTDKWGNAFQSLIDLVFPGVGPIGDGPKTVSLSLGDSRQG